MISYNKEVKEISSGGFLVEVRRLELRAKSQGLLENKSCPAVDKENGARATGRCL